VHHKSIHTNLYLDDKSHHHPYNKQMVLYTLVHRARVLWDEDSLQAELVFLRDVFKQNGHNWQIRSALNHCPHLDQPDNKPNSAAFLPFVEPIFNWISRVLAQHNIKSVGLPNMKLPGLLHSVKAHLGLRTPGVYRIPCECGGIGQTVHSVDIRLKESQQNIQPEHLDKSALPEHSIEHWHCIQFHNSSILAMKTRYMESTDWTLPLQYEKRVAIVSVNHMSRNLLLDP
jgi:hypothetical protein